MIEASCHCGAVRLAVPRPPADLNDCQCDHCQKRGTLWAYYALSETQLLSDPVSMSSYVWGDRQIRFHFCLTCGCSTHWTPVSPSRDRMGLNGRLLPRDILDALPRRQSPGPGRKAR